ncbi:MAG: L-fucose:H+ symporter permease [Calditrichaceae bacterium]|nr:L-fucose:H+ symporter permease [Calditrichaceae bacterium]RQV92273.1 MAG: L-fucose:H+ symporter permease [Calditrichota bacterium]
MINRKTNLMPASIVWPFFLITSLFAWWGLANNMTDTLLAAFKRIMSMSDSQTALIQVVFYGAGYGLLAIPAAIFIKKYSYKSGVLLGLGLYIIGALLFYPAKLTANYYYFLAAIWILSGGLSILETAANPYIIAMGPEETGTRRLNFAQSFNPLGSIMGVFLSKLFILSELNSASAQERAAMNIRELQAIQSGELNAVTMTYVVVGLFLLITWILIAINKSMPKAYDNRGPLNLLPTFKRLIKNRHYVWGVIAQFFYVGAQIGVWSFTIRYVMQELNLNEADASSYYIAALVLFTISRFMCTWLMKFIAPGNLLAYLSVLAVLLSIIVVTSGGYPGVLALVGISGCMSLMFPTIFGLAVRGLGEDTKIGGSGVIMAILGGAVITQIQGFVSDFTQSINTAYLVPLICFVIIAYYGLAASKKDLPAVVSE